MRGRDNSAWKKWEGRLQSLREASRLRHDHSFRSCPRTPEVGEVVTVHDSSRPRAVWRFGIIQECVKSADGQIRTVKLKVSN